MRRRRARTCSGWGVRRSVADTPDRGPGGAGWAAALGVLALVVGAAATIVDKDESLRWLWRWLIVVGALVGAAAVVHGSPWWQHRQAAKRERSEQAALQGRDQRDHFGPRGRGVLPFGRRQGWYFTGRIQALGELASWLASDRPPAVRVVTGAPGSGKSAVLGRLVLLAHPDGRKAALRADPEVDPTTLPPEGSIELSVHARGRTSQEIVEAIAATVGVEVASAEDLLAVLQARDRPVTVVIDAVDEAAGAGEVAGLLARLAATGGTRLLVGCRKDLVDRFVPVDEAMDLDDKSVYLPAGDVAAYVRRCLLLDGDPDAATPYRGQHDLAGRVAAAVADRADGNFLIAQLVSVALVNAGRVVEESEPGWQEELPREVGAAMRAYLDAFGAERPRVRDLLVPLAFAEAEGLADEALWATLASELGTATYTPQDVRWLLRDTAAANLLQATELGNGQVAWRLFHQALAEYLRRHEAQLPAREAQWRITQFLIGQVPRRDGQYDWQRAHPYARRHLATHAAEGNSALLDGLLVDPGFLLAADPGRLLRVMPVAARPRIARLARAYRSAVHLLHGRSVAEAASYLELYARQAGADELANRITDLPLSRPWSTLWVRAGATHTGQVIGDHGEWVTALALCETEGGLVVISGADDGTLRVWDPVAGGPVGQPLEAHNGRVTALAVAGLEGRTMLVSGGQDGMIRLWNLAARRLVDEMRHEGEVTALSVGTYKDRPVLVSAGYDRHRREGWVWVWGLNSREGRQLLDDQGRVGAVALTELAGRPVVACGSGGAVQVHDFSDGSLVGIPLLTDYHLRADGTWIRPETASDTRNVLDATSIAASDTPDVTSIAASDLDGVRVVAAAYDDGSVRLWDAANHTLLYRVERKRDETIGVADKHSQVMDAHDLPYKSMTTLLAVAKLDARSVIVSCAADQAVRIFDLPSGAQVGQPLLGHEKPIHAVAVGEQHRRPIVVSGDSDGEIRLWDLAIDVASDTEQFSGHLGGVNAIAIGELADRAVAVSGGADTTVRVWDLTDGTPLGVWSHGARLGAVTVAALDGRPVVVSGGIDGMVRVWSLADGSPIGGPLVGSEHPNALMRMVFSVAAGALHGRPVVVAGGSDGSIRVWDLSKRDLVGEPIPPVYIRGLSFPQQMYAVATGDLDGCPVVVSGGSEGIVRVWDLASVRPLGDPLPSPEAFGTIHAIAIGELDGSLVAVVGWTASLGKDCEVGIWDLANRRRVGMPLRGHECGILAGIKTVAIGRVDGRTVVVSGADDGTIRVWDPSQPDATQVIVLPAASNSLALTPTGACIVGTAQGLVALQLRG
jgi:WD40 repeat protein